MADEDNEDLPWASPGVREGYESALGRFMLTFNEIDNRLTEIMEIILKRICRQHLVNFSTKCHALGNRRRIRDMLERSVVPPY